MHRGRRVEDWVELTAAAIARARAELGDDEVARRASAVVSDADRETAVRVLRTLGRELSSGGGPDLTGLDARLRAAGEPAGAAGDSPATGGTAGDTAPDDEASGGRNLPKGGPVRPIDVARQLARLRNPILPHPRRRPGAS